MRKKVSYKMSGKEVGVFFSWCTVIIFGEIYRIEMKSV